MDTFIGQKNDVRRCCLVNNSLFVGVKQCVVGIEPLENWRSYFRPVISDSILRKPFDKVDSS